MGQKKRSQKKATQGSRRGRRSGTPDLSSDEAAFAALEAQLQSMPEEGLAPVRVDLDAGAQAAIALAARGDLEAERFALLDQAQPGTHDALLALPVIARAARYAKTRRDQLEVTEDGTTIDPAVASDATALRARMLSVVSYNVEAPGVAERVAYIRRGSGYRDLAVDLVECAKLYDEFAKDLVPDKKKYDPKDAARARKFADLIQTELDSTHSGALARWRLTTTQAHTLLVETYERVRRALLFLAPVSTPEDAIPTLYSAARAANPRPKRDAGASAGGDEADGAGGPEGGGPG
jgi:hypothetical protein